MDSPLPILLILGFYFWFVTNGGIKFMKDRQPFQLNNVMMIYNLVQVILNFALMIYVSKIRTKPNLLKLIMVILDVLPFIFSRLLLI
jgi:hypothetical protein